MGGCTHTTVNYAWWGDSQRGIMVPGSGASGMYPFMIQISTVVPGRIMHKDANMVFVKLLDDGLVWPISIVLNSTAVGSRAVWLLRAIFSSSCFFLTSTTTGYRVRIVRGLTYTFRNCAASGCRKILQVTGCKRSGRHATW